MKPLSDLVVREATTWTELERQIASAKNRCEVLPRDSANAEATLLVMQVTTRSTLGAIAFESSGLLVDSGWVRVLGGGEERVTTSIAAWNFDSPLAIEDALIVAIDAVGGVFALDGGAFGRSDGRAWYFGPDTLAWTDLNLGYTGLIAFLLGGDLDKFYGALRWPSWREDLRVLAADQGFSQYPPPFTKEAREPGVLRRPVPLLELVPFYRDCARQLG